MKLKTFYNYSVPSYRMKRLSLRDSRYYLFPRLFPFKKNFNVYPILCTVYVDVFTIEFLFCPVNTPQLVILYLGGRESPDVYLESRNYRTRGEYCEVDGKVSLHRDPAA